MPAFSRASKLIVSPEWRSTEFIGVGNPPRYIQLAAEYLF
jgi:hypothetical protein